jgi:hypothetical protein
MEHGPLDRGQNGVASHEDHDPDARAIHVAEESMQEFRHELDAQRRDHTTHVATVDDRFDRLQMTVDVVGTELLAVQRELESTRQELGRSNGLLRSLAQELRDYKDNIGEYIRLAISRADAPTFPSPPRGDPTRPGGGGGEGGGGRGVRPCRTAWIDGSVRSARDGR